MAFVTKTASSSFPAKAGLAQILQETLNKFSAEDIVQRSDLLTLLTILERKESEANAMENAANYNMQSITLGGMNSGIVVLTKEMTEDVEAENIMLFNDSKSEIGERKTENRTDDVHNDDI
ncbi:hypothetical protein SK128_018281, partial [Halocaridina rubra]